MGSGRTYNNDLFSSNANESSTQWQLLVVTLS
jgi:hypothetical protein